jgi:hypothetical protein
VISTGTDEVAQLERDRVADDLATDLGERMEHVCEQNRHSTKYYHGQKDKHAKLRREQDADHEARGGKHPHGNRSFQRNAASPIHNECLSGDGAVDY